MNITKEDIICGLHNLGVETGMDLEVHSSLSSFGNIKGGAQTLINALIQVIGHNGSIVMPSLKFSEYLPLNEQDKKLGVTCKIKILKGDELRSGMGIVSDTFRCMHDVITGDGTFRVSAWGKDNHKHCSSFSHLIDIDGWALLLGVDIYKLTTMHYVEDILPKEISDIFTPSDEVRNIYPEEQWFIETGEPPVKPWYTIQQLAYEKGFIKDGMIGNSKCMLFKIKDIIGLYRKALECDPLELYGLK